MERIEDLAKVAFEENSKKGFWDEDRDVLEALALVNTELSESIEAYRKVKHAELDKVDEANFKESFEQHVKDTVEDELADSLIRMADFYGGMGFVTNEKHIKEGFPEYDEIVNSSISYINLSKNFSKSIFFIQKMICNIDNELNNFLVSSEEFAKKLEGEDIKDDAKMIELMSEFGFCSYFRKQGLVMPTSLDMAYKCLYSFAKSLNVDIDKHIELKRKYNSTRAYKHGKKF